MLINESALRRIIREEIARSLISEQAQLGKFTSAVQGMAQNSPNYAAAARYQAYWNTLRRVIEAVGSEFGETPVGRMKTPALTKLASDFAGLGSKSPLAPLVLRASENRGAGSTKVAAMLAALLGSKGPVDDAKLAFDGSGSTAEQSLYLQGKPLTVNGQELIKALTFMAMNDPVALITAPAAPAAPAAPQTKPYTVKRGDILSQIALTFYGDGRAPAYQALGKALGISPPYGLQAGQVLQLPAEITVANRKLPIVGQKIAEGRSRGQRRFDRF